MELPFWWDLREFFEKYGDRRFDTGHPIYGDYALLLAGWETIADADGTDVPVVVGGTGPGQAGGRPGFADRGGDDGSGARPG